LLATINYFKALASSAVSQMAEYLAQKRTDLVDSLWINLTAPVRSVALFMRQRFLSPIYEILDRMESIVDFVAHLTIPLSD
jgi:hypothetical protein